LSSQHEEGISSKLLHDELKEQLRLKIHQYGDFSFQDDIWYCNKMHKNASNKNKFTIKFDSIDNEYKEIVKYYALLKEDSISTVNEKVGNIGEFINYLNECFPDYKLYHVNYKIIDHYEKYLRSNGVSENRNSINYAWTSDFFNTMSGFSELPNVMPAKRKNPFKQNRSKNARKYIPTNVAQQYDKIMFDESNGIPLVIRVMYWLQRSFPNRITEVCSIEHDCLRSLYDMYVINIPSWKQNGGYLLPEIKTLPIMNSGHGKYIIDLIKKFQEERKTLLERLPTVDKDKQYLLVSPLIRFEFKGNQPRITCDAIIYNNLQELKEMYPSITYEELSYKLGQIGIYRSPNSINRIMNKEFSSKHLENKVLTKGRVYSILNNVARFFKITDEYGEIYKVSSHQFRHNATTDRLYIGGYTLDQVRSIRHDKGEKMLLQYAHQQKEMHKKMWMDSTGLISPTEAPVEFKGKIINLEDEKLVTALTKSPNMYLTWEANSKKGVGLCSMIQGCNPSGTSVHFECYECNWFVPKAEFYEDYKKELVYWDNIANGSVGQAKRIATFENAIRNVNILERIVQICENGIEAYKKELEQKLLKDVL
jgi:hypothetical protein